MSYNIKSSKILLYKINICKIIEKFFRITINNDKCQFQ